MNELAVLAEMNGMDRVGAQLEVPCSRNHLSALSRSARFTS